MYKVMSIFVVLLFLFLGCSNETQVKEVKNIVIFSPLVHKSLNSEIAGFKEGLKDKNWKDGDNVNYIDLNAGGNWEEIGRMLETAYSEQPDLVFVVTTPAAQTAAKLCKKYNVPTIYGAVTDPVVSGIVKTLEKSEFPITGVTDRYPTKEQSEFFVSFFNKPKNEKALILYTPSEKNSQILSSETEKYMNDFGIYSKRVVVEDINNLNKKLESIIDEFTIVIVNGDNTIIERIASVSNLCKRKKKPLFVGDPLSVKLGALGALGPDYYMMGKLASDKANRVLRGEFTGDILSSNPVKFSKVVNTKFASEIDFIIPVSVWGGSSEWESEQ